MCTTQKTVAWSQKGIFRPSEVRAILGDQEIRLYGLICALMVIDSYLSFLIYLKQQVMIE